MAKIIVNDDLEIKGNLNFERSFKEKDTIQGVLSTHLYFGDIKCLETNRYNLSGIEVYREVFDSDSYNILYYFTAKKLEILGAKTNGAVYILYGDEMRMIEEEMYKNEHPILGNIGEEYKDMYISNDKYDERENEEEVNNKREQAIKCANVLIQMFYDEVAPFGEDQYLYEFIKDLRNGLTVEKALDKFKTSMKSENAIAIKCLEVTLESLVSNLKEKNII